MNTPRLDEWQMKPLNPLLNDLVEQRRRVYEVVRKLALLVALLFVCDRLVDVVLFHGMKAYFGFGFDRPVAVACIGHSRTVLGVDGDLLERQLGTPVSKYAVQGANMADRFAMLRHLMAQRPGEIKLVAFDVSAFTFNDSGLSSNSYRLFLPFLNEPEMGDHVRRYCDSTGELLLRRLVKTSRYSEETMSLAARGHLGLRGNLKWGQLDMPRLQRRIAAGKFQQMRIRQEGLDVFDDMVRYAKDQGARVVLAYIPTVDLVNNIDRDAHDQVVQLLTDYADDQHDVFFIDYNREYETKHDLFYEGIHLNAKGQQLVTMRLVEDLRSIMAEGVVAERVEAAGGGKLSVKFQEANDK